MLTQLLKTHLLCNNRLKLRVQHQKSLHWWVL